ncbi:hypothetical protein Leryth_015605 [Lithospermum erythrorhizon]|nr:hypothetical protein Leryth_015605 [Lithospermum erythrorhizon]
MCPFYQEEKPNPCQRCKCFSSTLKDLVFTCPVFCGRLSTTSHKEQEADIEFDEEEEVFVSAVISAYVESKSKRQACNRMEKISSFSWVYSPVSGDNMNLEKLHLEEKLEDQETESFFDACSNLSCYSVPASIDAFVSAQASFSRSSSLNWLDLHTTSQRHPSIIENFRHCEGWPFGLSRKTLLLPPLPKSPSDSWSWRKNGGKLRVRY